MSKTNLNAAYEQEDIEEAIESVQEDNVLSDALEYSEISDCEETGRTSDQIIVSKPKVKAEDVLSYNDFYNDIYCKFCRSHEFIKNLQCLDSKVLLNYENHYKKRIEIRQDLNGACGWIKYFSNETPFWYQRFKFYRQLLETCFSDVEFVYPFEVLTDEEQEVMLKKAVGSVNDNFLYLCYILGTCDKVHYSYFQGYNFYEYCEKFLSIARTTAKNMVSIYKKFCLEGKAELQDKFMGYGFSQLAELTSVDDNLLSYFKPDMTVKQIREKKKQLANGLSDKEEKPEKVKAAAKKEEPENEQRFTYADIRAAFSKVKNPYYKSGVSDEKQSSSFKAWQKCYDALLEKMGELVKE